MEQSSYSAFAYVYDELMDNVPYDAWAEYLIKLLKKYGVKDGLVCELGCGTGQMTRRLFQNGYDMIGIDLSEDMLEVAREQEYAVWEEAFSEDDGEEPEDSAEEAETPEQEERRQILYLQQDMRSFELYGTVAAVVSICDSMNYITDPKDLLQVFRLVNNYLDPNGIFIFDMNTEYKYRELLGDRTIAEAREDSSFIWENYYDAETQLNEYGLTLFLPAEESKNGQQLYERYEEVHVQRAYRLSEVKELLAEAGMQFVAAYNVLTEEEPGETCERMYIVAREGHQEGKMYL